MPGLTLTRGRKGSGDAPAPRVGPAASATSGPPQLTFVIGDGRQLLNSTPMFLTAGLARRLGGCQGHGGRAGEVARLQEQEGELTAATLGGSWGAVPIRNIEDLPGRGWEMGDDSALALRTAELWVALGAFLCPCFHPLFITHSDSRTLLPQVTDSPAAPAPSKGKPLLSLPWRCVLVPASTCSRCIIAYLFEWFLMVSSLSGCKPHAGRDLLGASHQDTVPL